MHSPPFSDLICSLPTASSSVVSIKFYIYMSFWSEKGGGAKVQSLWRILHEFTSKEQRKRAGSRDFFAASQSEHLKSPIITPSVVEGVEKQ